MKNFNVTAYMPTTNKSVLVYGEYKGFTLVTDKKYRPTNLDKVNSILALAVENNQNAYLVEVYENESLVPLVDAFKQQDEKFKYLKLVLDSHIQLLLFTKLDQQTTEAIVFSNLSDCGFKNSIISVQSNIFETTTIAYSFAEHYLVPKHAKKAKQFVGSELLPSEKDLGLVFEMTAKVIRPS